MTDHNPAEAAAVTIEQAINYYNRLCESYDIDPVVKEDMVQYIRDAYATQTAELAAAKAELVTLREQLDKAKTFIAECIKAAAENCENTTQPNEADKNESGSND